jgi:hypothetical protein
VTGHVVFFFPKVAQPPVVLKIPACPYMSSLAGTLSCRALSLSRQCRDMSGCVHIDLRETIALSGHVMYICPDESRQDPKKQASSCKKELINFH